MVDRGFPFSRGVPAGDIGGAHFEFEGTGDAVPGLERVGFGILPVLVQIDEARRDHQAFGVNDFAPLQGLRGDGLDGATVDPHRTHRVQFGFRIDYAAIGDHHIIGLSGERGTQAEKEKSPHGA